MDHARKATIHDAMQREARIAYGGKGNIKALVETIFLLNKELAHEVGKKERDAPIVMQRFFRIGAAAQALRNSLRFCCPADEGTLLIDLVQPMTEQGLSQSMNNWIENKITPSYHQMYGGRILTGTLHSYRPNDVTSSLTPEKVMVYRRAAAEIESLAATAIERSDIDLLRLERRGMGGR